MKDNLKDRKAAMRARNAPEPGKAVPTCPPSRVPPDLAEVMLSQARYRIEEQAGLFIVRDSISGLIISYSTKEKGGLQTAMRLNGLVHKARERQAEIKVKKSGKNNGVRWSKFGVVNTDTSSPIHKSIRNWGLKIKAREDRPSAKLPTQ
jgi:hypothetical protein